MSSDLKTNLNAVGESRAVSTERKKRTRKMRFFCIISTSTTTTTTNNNNNNNNIIMIGIINHARKININDSTTTIASVPSSSCTELASLSMLHADALPSSEPFCIYARVGLAE